MTSSVAVSPTESVDVPTPSARKGAAIVVATVLTLGSAGAWGYTQWWVPGQQAQQVAQEKLDRCLDEVQAYMGTDGYAARVSQCETNAASQGG